MKAILSQLLTGQTLSETQAQQTFDRIMSAESNPAQLGAFLALLAVRAPTVEELVGAARAMRRYVRPVRAPANVIDTCGTGGAQSRLFNISTAAAIVAAACGIPVAKHGNRAVTSRCGSADVLKALGVAVSDDLATPERCLRQAGIGFCFAPCHHPAMARAAPVRQALGFATIFNWMGPLTNPAGARRQVAGVPRPDRVATLLHAFIRLNAERAMVVCGTDPEEGYLCELSLGGPTTVGQFAAGNVRMFVFHPADAGLKPASVRSCRVDSAEQSAAIIRRVFDGAPGPARDLVLLNAAAALWAAGRVDDLRAGLPLAASAIDSGRAAATLQKLITASQPRPVSGTADI